MKSSFYFNSEVGKVESREITINDVVNLESTMVLCKEFVTSVFEAEGRYVPFAYTASADGSNDFTLTSSPIQNSLGLFVEGIGQSFTNGDFSISGTSLIVPDLLSGDKVFGCYAF